MILLHEQHKKEIEAHGERDYPHECGGMLIGHFDAEKGKSVIELMPMENSSAEETRHNRVLILPKDVMRAERYAREKNSMSSVITIRIRMTERFRHSSI